jgi:hypothetical protein
MIDAANQRWLALWHALGEDAFARGYTHTVRGEVDSGNAPAFLRVACSTYIAQVTTLRAREGLQA